MLTFNPNNSFEDGNFFMSKALHELNIHELAYVHLNTLHGLTILNDRTIFSSLHDLKENLQASLINKRTKNYTPLFTAFSILDQIGNTYSPNGKSSNAQNGIKRSLTFFSNCTDSDIKSLVMLRNGLYHNGSLVCKKQNNSQQNVIYRLCSTGGDLVIHPNTEWDGIFRDDLANYLSKVDVVTLKKVVFEACQECFNLLKTGQLNISINDPKEFFFKYLFSS